MVKAVAPGVFEMGEIVLDKNRHTASFPAVINMTNGPLEYLLVTSYGKKHESLLRTDVLPYHLHLGMLLLGLSAPTNVADAPPPSQIKNPSSAPIPGAKLSIEVSWMTASTTVTFPAEDLIYNLASKAPLGREAWVYNGSEIWDGHFLAQRDGSIVSLATDLSALMNNGGPGHDNDHIWTASSNNMPALNTPVVVTLRLPAPALTK